MGEKLLILLLLAIVISLYLKKQPCEPCTEDAECLPFVGYCFLKPLANQRSVSPDDVKVDKYSPGVKLIYEDGYGNAISTRRSLVSNGARDNGIQLKRDFLCLVESTYGIDLEDSKKLNTCQVNQIFSIVLTGILLICSLLSFKNGLSLDCFSKSATNGTFQGGRNPDSKREVVVVRV